ncbi:uncharacterized protein LOC117181695 [Belonocnema kinseyi]|uniref:uncharacterized protein LOC117181695 n=1 Tax=Belonocnema kinseyi TaxID=2817044 RepID=UPI00143DB7EA|nr:uncharacterized protein LOC117181695 [Belonocnema kinseyi]
MRVHRSERVGRKPYHCLSMRQRRRIRQEIKLIQESVEAESKRNQNSKEGEALTAQTEEIAENGIPQQGNVMCSVPADVYIPASTNSYPSSQEVIDPIIPGSTLAGTYSYPMQFLPGPSGFPTAIAGNGLSSAVFKTETYMANHQQVALNVGEQTAVFDHQVHNAEILDQLKKLNGKLDTYNNHLNTINSRLENIERHMKQEKRKGQAPVKPSIIPMQTVQEVTDFDNASDEAYDGLVQYLKYIGGFTLREALNLCMKEVLTNDVASNFTWHGKDTGHAQVGVALYNRQITNAFYEAVSQSQHFEQPTRAMFASQMREVLRIAKQRLRNTLRKQQVQQTDGDRDEDPWE